jgi:sugar lactone lactonase YvrE
LSLTKSSSTQLTAFSLSATIGGNNSINGTEQRSSKSSHPPKKKNSPPLTPPPPGIRTLDPFTNKTTTLLNNYYGHYLNGPDDLTIDASGCVWFTDPWNAWLIRLTDTPPQLPAATYRLDPKTGAVTVVDTSLVQPNGIALSPDGKHLYIVDSAALGGDYSPTSSGPGLNFDPTGPRTVFKFDVVDNGTHITGKRPIWLSQDYIPDGLKVAANGFVLAATGNGVDVLDPVGVLIARVQTNYTVVNFAWAGEGLDEFWMVGQGGVSRVRWNLRGQDLAKSTA